MKMMMIEQTRMLRRYKSWFRKRQCAVCGNDFRNEKGFEARSFTQPKKYMCGQCAPTWRAARRNLLGL